MTTPHSDHIHIGKATSRVDGVAKVTGQAKYAAEHPVRGLLHGYVISSPITRGRIKSLDASAALDLPGVATVISHLNRPAMADANRRYNDDDAPTGHHLRPLYDDQIRYNFQPVALVVAETVALARHAASLVHIQYESDDFQTSMQTAIHTAAPPKHRRGFFEPPKSRGHAPRVMATSPVTAGGRFTTPVEHHNPMEPHASTVVWEGGGKLTIYDKNQGVQNAQAYICNIFGLKKDDVRVLAPFVGGAFGSGLRPQYQLVLAVMAAQMLSRSVRVSLTRQQMFSFGHRPSSIQDLKIGADTTGKLQAIEHDAVCETSRFEEYTDVVVNWSGMLYTCDDVRLSYKVCPLDLHSPLDMRAPGAPVGMFALESTMDEIAAAIPMDPVAFRRRNHTDTDANHFHRPFASKELLACYDKAAARFGWSQRNPTPRSTRDGHHLVGWGMATGIWEAPRMGASAKAALTPDGRLTVSSATCDMGTGTYTIMTQIAAEALGLPLGRVKAELGDSSLPPAPISGGSFTAATIGTVVHQACIKLRQKLFQTARRLPDSPFLDAAYDDAVFADGYIMLGSVDGPRLPLTDLFHSVQDEPIAATVTANTMLTMLKQMPYTRSTHSAVFVEVKVDEDFGMIEVPRVVIAVAAGTIVNPKTARSQIIGGVVWGISMALHEESQLDHRYGRFMNASFADYHIPVAKDIGGIEVIFVDEEDWVTSPLGIKGVGEIGVVGTAAAVANAVYHATGKRVRDLPITPDKLL